MSSRDLTYRTHLVPEDVDAVRGLVEGTGFFNADEIRIAAELVSERLARGEQSGYEFVFAERDGEVVAYSCWGPVDGTRESFDLYWIAVRNDLRGLGLGRLVLGETEAAIARRGGGLVWVETGGRPQYAATRAFYERCGYRLEGELGDFYAPGDAKRIYVKRVAGGR